MNPDRRSFMLSGGAAVAGLLTTQVDAAQQPNDPIAAAKDFVAAYEKKMRPLELTANIAWWDANTSGKDDDFRRKEEAQNKIDAALSDTKLFATLKGIKAARDAGKIADAILAREVDVLYLMYLEKQVAPDLLKKITAKANAVEQAFNNFRAKVDGKEITDSKVRSRPQEFDRFRGT